MEDRPFLGEKVRFFAFFLLPQARCSEGGAAQGWRGCGECRDVKKRPAFRVGGSEWGVLRCAAAALRRDANPLAINYVAVGLKLFFCACVLALSAGLDRCVWEIWQSRH